MAYAATATVAENRTISGRRYVVVTISESDASATDEWSVQLPFSVGQIVLYNATLTGGAGNTINPRLGRASGWTANTQDDLATNNSTAANIQDQSKLAFYIDSGGTLYGVSQVDTGTDNTIETEIHIVEGVL